MTPEQINTLRDLSARLFEVVVIEVDPRNWSGQGKRPKDMTQEERGNDVWCRRQAVASLTLLTQVNRLIETPVVMPESEEDVEAMIKQAEEQAAIMIRKAGMRS